MAQQETEEIDTNKDTSGGWSTYMESKKRKLMQQFNKNCGTGEQTMSHVLSGICIYVNGYTDPPADVLKRLMQANGGKYSSYPGHGVTHVVASNLPHSKIERLQTGEKVVTPDWILDSIKVGRLLPDTDYLLYGKKQGCGLLQQYLIKPQAPGSSHDVSVDDVPCTNDPSTSSSDALQPPNDVSLHLEPSDNANSLMVRQSERTPFPKTTDPRFLQEFYSRSRLHHISMWGQEMKDWVMELREGCDGGFPGLDRFRQYLIANDVARSESIESEKVFMHLDMDCFFVSVGIRNRPELLGKPVVVTHSKGVGPQSNVSFESRAEIASCSYEARKAGLKNGMLLGRAQKLCPGLTPIPYDFEAYHEVSKQLYATVAEFTTEIEAVSCDELYADLTPVLHSLRMPPLTLAQFIRGEVLRKTRCQASAGLGPNMLVARLATKKAKPNGQHYIPSKDVQRFMSTQPVDALPGVGWRAAQRLRELGVTTCAQLSAMSVHALTRAFGPKTAVNLRDAASGIDKRPLETEKVRKSISCEVNYGIRLRTMEEVEVFLKQFVDEVVRRLCKAKMRTKSVTLKLLVGICLSRLEDTRKSKLTRADQTANDFFRKAAPSTTDDRLPGNNVDFCPLQPSNSNAVSSTVSSKRRAQSDFAAGQEICPLFFGFSDYESVKMKLKELVSTNNDPSVSLSAEISDYLVSMVHNRSLKTVQMLLRVWFRFISRSDCGLDKWMRVYETTLNDVQAAVLMEYGSWLSDIPV